MDPNEITHLRTRMRAGDVKAQVELGRRLLTGTGVSPSPQEGVALIADAADKKNGEATALLALFATWGVLRPRNLDEGLDTLAKAAKLGWKPAQRELQFLARARGDDWRDLRAKIDVAGWTKAPPAHVESEAPRIRVFEGFATPAECDWLIERARNNLKRAMVYRRDAVGTVASADRTNTEADYTAEVADIVLNLVRERIATAVGMPVTFFEVTKLLHYEPGQQFHLHSDFIETDAPGVAQDVQQHGQRLATFLVYLNDDYEGGETDFPRVNYRYKGKRGDALLFFNLLPDGAPDYSTLHAGLPPASGVKWLLSQWIRTKPLSPG